MPILRPYVPLLLCAASGVLLVAAGRDSRAATEPPLFRSARSGAWSAPSTWSTGSVPIAGAKVQIRAGDRVVYDVRSDTAYRTVHVAGTLTFAPDRDTQLCAGLIKVQAGNDLSENGFDCDAHLPTPDPKAPQPVLEVGTADRPVAADHTAVIRLVYFEGMDKESCPALVSCGGRMELHGAPLRRTWVKLAEPAAAGASTVTLSETVEGWRPGDHLILTSTSRQIKVKKTFLPSVKDGTETEERAVRSIQGTTLTLDRPLAFTHAAAGDYRGEVANLSRNVVVESADPQAARGHTMYHRGSAGSISYAELRHLGKEGVLGRYSLHFHRAGDTMRGSSVIGASIWDSGNRWITIHGTDYLVVRDCVGYRSTGHGFFLEDGTEQYNVLDHNLAVQACGGKPLPKQIFPVDHNEGAGFWWANSRNSFTRNVAAECDEYGYRFDASPSPGFNLTMAVRQPDGVAKEADIRTLPFIRFEDNEAHTQRRHAFNLGGAGGKDNAGVGEVGPDDRHPFQIRNFRVWDAHWAIHPAAPSVLVDKLDVHQAEYGVWRPIYNRHAYRGLSLDQVTVKKEFLPMGTTPVEADYPKPLAPVDDLPPATVITHVTRAAGKVTVRGTTCDDGTVRTVQVNGREAKAISPNFSEWEVVLDAPTGPLTLTARSEDAAGNREQTPHVRTVP